MQNFDLKNIPRLDICVLGALESLFEKKLPKINIEKGKILVIGSGNALAVGRIIFRKNNVVFADESNYREKIENIKFNQAVLISASGGKHAPIIARYLNKKRIKTILFTNNPKASAKKFVSKSLVFPKQREPYTYNTSTYLSMILAMTKENIEQIYNQINKVEKILNKNKLSGKEFFLVIPPRFNEAREMIVTKFDELFGSKIIGRVYTSEQIKHAKTLIPSTDELFISFEKKNNFGKKKLFIPFSSNAGFGEMMALGYFVIGRIQKNNNLFKKNVVNYCKKTSKIFDEQIKPIVE